MFALGKWNQDIHTTWLLPFFLMCLTISAIHAGPGNDISSDNALSVYSQAFEALRKNDLNSAELGFRTVIQRHGETDYLLDAKYWLGEVLFRKGAFDEATLEFADVYRSSTSDKKADSLYKLGLCLHLTGKPARAITVLEAVSLYPTSSAAELAADYLDTIRDRRIISGESLPAILADIPIGLPPGSRQTETQVPTTPDLEDNPIAKPEASGGT